MPVRYSECVSDGKFRKQNCFKGSYEGKQDCSWSFEMKILMCCVAEHLQCKHLFLVQEQLGESHKNAYFNPKENRTKFLEEAYICTDNILFISSLLKNIINAMHNK